MWALSWIIQECQSGKKETGQQKQRAERPCDVEIKSASILEKARKRILP